MFSKLQTSSDGLSTAEATARLQTYGPNELIMAKRAGPLYVFLSQFKSPMVIVLLAAIVVSVLVSILAGSEEDRGLVDAAVIAIIVVANAVLGFIQEYRSERALEALRKMATPTARVVRNGQVSEVDSRELVPGDLIVVESGDRIPADARVIRSIGFTVDESILTGESQPVSKTESPMSSRNVPIGLLKNMIFQSTMAVSGKCQAVVVTTGMKTEFGRIAQSVQQFEEITTPLQEDLDEMGKKLGVAVIVLAAIILSAEVLRDVSGSLVEEMMTAIALAVSAIPEGLPAVVTITLAIGVQRMVQKNALVRRLSSVETLGSTTVICSDKTGTITKNEMTVTVVYADGRIIDVTGTGYQQDGEFLLDGKKIDPLARPTLRQLLLIGQLCNNSALQVDHSKTGGFVPVGDPTEAALLVLAEKGGLHRGETIGKYTEVHELSFDSIRKRMTSILVTPAGERYAFTKGAPELLLPLCDRMLHDGRMTEMTNEVRDSILRTNAELARKALRLLALAYRPLGDDVSDYTPEHVERNMVFVGLVGMIDPPRNEVPQAVDLCKKAGIRVMMMTGDNQLTAGAIACAVGISEHADDVITGDQLQMMDAQEFERHVTERNVFARVSPEHKMRVVSLLRKRQNVVAMTGDGVNDAPAIKSADIGVAMGLRGADVTREASDIVLLDDNFATIVAAVEKGREIYSNIRKFVRFLLSANFDELFLVFVVVMMGLPLPITAVQILLLNLATDGFPALALGVDPPEEGLMERPPRDPNTKLLDRQMVTFIVIGGIVAFLAGFIVFLYMIWAYGGYIPGLGAPSISAGEWVVGVSDVTGASWSDVLTHARTAVFASVVTFELLFVWNCRSERRPVWRTSLRGATRLAIAVVSSFVLTLCVVYLPPLHVMFQTTPLSLLDWGVILLTSIPGLFIPPHIIFKERQR